MNCPICRRPMIGVEYAYDHPDHWDGVSEWLCEDHPTPVRLNRFTGKELGHDETVPRNGRPG